MPLKEFTVTKKFGDSKKRILFKDCRICLDEFLSDENTKTPAQIFSDFESYLRNKYQSGVYGGTFIRKNTDVDSEDVMYSSKSSANLTFYVPKEYSKEQVLNDIKEFEKRYNGAVKIKIDMKETTSAEYPEVGKNSYSNLKSYHNKSKLEDPTKKTQLEKAIEIFKDKYQRDPNLNNQEDKKEIAFIANFESLKNTRGALDYAIKLFKLNWGSEPNLNDKEDVEELILLYNLDIDELRDYYSVEAIMYFKEDDFSPRYPGRKEINLNKYKYDSKQNKEDNKMKKDSKKLTKEQLEEIKKISKPYYIFSTTEDYNLEDPFMSDQNGIESLSWKKLYTNLQDDNILKEVFGDISLEEFSKFDPKTVINKLDNVNLDSTSSNKFSDFIFVNDLEQYFKNALVLKEEMEIEDYNQIMDIFKNKMKKDADPRLELVEKIKMKEHPDYKNNKYDLNDDFVVYSDYQFNSYPKEGLLKLDWVAADLSEDGYTSEEAMKWDNQKIVNYLQNIIDNDPYSASIQGLVDLNTIDGLKRILKRAWDWNGEDNSVNDSKQEQICDSFSKRYNK